MIFIFLSIILFSIVLCGWGFLFLNFFGFSRNIKNPWVFLFAGYGILVIFTSYIALFKKLDEFILLFVVAIGVSSFILLPKGMLVSNFSKISLALFGIVSFCIVFNTGASLGGKIFLPGTDTPGYHLGIVSWLNNFSSVPGLANLHFRLGNYSGYLQLAAIMDNYRWNNLSPFIMPGLFFFSFCSYFIWDLMYLLYEKNNKIKVKIWIIFYSTPLLLMSIFYYFSTFNSSPNLYYDILPMFLSAIIVNEIMKYFLNGDKEKCVSLLQFVFIINLLSIAAYLSKQNAAPIVLLIAIWSVYLLFLNKLFGIKNLLTIFSLPLIGFLGSVISNLITSGYPLFPLPMIYINFPWTAPMELVNTAYTAVKYWAKLPGVDYMSVADNGFLYWFVPWIKRNMLDPIFVNLALYTFVVGIVAWLVNMGFCIKKQKKYYWLFFAIFLNLLYWFLLAPDIRFGVLFFIIFFASGTAILALFLGEIYKATIVKIINQYNFIIIMLFSFIIMWWSIDVSKSVAIIKGMDNYFYITNTMEPNEFNEKKMTTRGGYDIKVYVPKDNACRSVPIPCTPYYSEDIKAFNGNNLGDGFYYEKMQ